VVGLTLIGFLAVACYVAATGGSDAFDRSASLDMLSTRSPALTLIARAVTVLGDGSVLVVFGVLVAWSMWRRDHDLARPAVLMATLAATAAIVTLLKLAFSRSRPLVGGVLGTPSLDYSFPSGHTTNGTVVYGLVAALLCLTVDRRRTRLILGGVSVVIALLIGWSRVYLGYHWATDVIAGWLLAIALISTARVALGLVWPRPMPIVSVPTNHRRSVQVHATDGGHPYHR